MLSKKYYEAIANIINTRLPNNKDKAMLVNDFIILCEADNSSFNRHRFADACYGVGKYKTQPYEQDR